MTPPLANTCWATLRSATKFLGSSCRVCDTLVSLRHVGHSTTRLPSREFLRSSFLAEEPEDLWLLPDCWLKDDEDVEPCTGLEESSSLESSEAAESFWV